MSAHNGYPETLGRLDWFGTVSGRWRVRVRRQDVLISQLCARRAEHLKKSLFVRMQEKEVSSGCEPRFLPFQVLFGSMVSQLIHGSRKVCML